LRDIKQYKREIDSGLVSEEGAAFSRPQIYR